MVVGSNPAVPTNGLWLSLVEHCVRDAGVVGSNPANPTVEGSAAWAAAGLESRSPVKAGGFDSWAFRHAFVAQRKSNRLLSGGSGFRNSPGAQHAVRALDALLGLLSPPCWVRFPGAAPSPASSTDRAAWS